jgi:hypothetical protein
MMGSFLMAFGIGPAIWVILVLTLTGGMPPSPVFGPSGLTGHDEGSGSRAEAQFMQFWFLISFFLLGIGAWLLFSGLKSIAVISKKD